MQTTNDVNELNDRGYRPLLEAARQDNLAAVQWLLQQGSDPNLPSLYGTSVLRYLSQSKPTPNKPAIERLLKNAGARNFSHFISSGKIMSLIKQFKFACEDHGGLCLGINSLGMIHAFGGMPDIEKFILRFNLMQNYKPDCLFAMIEKAREIRKKITSQKKNHALDKIALQKKIDAALLNRFGPVGLHLLDLEAELQAVVICVGVSDFKELFTKKIQSYFTHNLTQSPTTSFPLVYSLALERKKIAKYYNCFGIYQANEMITLFKLWRDEFKKIKLDDTIGFLFFINGHAFSISYLPKEDSWVHVNNSTSILKSDKDILQAFLFSCENAKIFPVVTHLFATEKESKKIINAAINLEKNVKWLELNKLTPEKKEILFSRKAIDLSINFYDPTFTKHLIEKGKLFQRNKYIDAK